MIEKLPKDWQGPMRNGVVSTGSALLVHGIVGVGKRMLSSNNDNAAEEDDWYEEMEDVYLDKGPEGLARFLKRHDPDIVDMQEARDCVEDFEDDNERIVRRYERSVDSEGEGDEDEASDRHRARRRRRRSRGRRATSGPSLQLS